MSDMLGNNFCGSQIETEFENRQVASKNVFITQLINHWLSCSIFKLIAINSLISSNSITCEEGRQVNQVSKGRGASYRSFNYQHVNPHLRNNNSSFPLFLSSYLYHSHTLSLSNFFLKKCNQHRWYQYSGSSLMSRRSLFPACVGRNNRS